MAIGMVIFVVHLIAGPLTGASINPARSLDPALIHGIWDDQWLYWAGPIVGGLIAAIAYMVIFVTKEDQDKPGTINIRSD